MDKILKPVGAGPSHEKITVTNDGATILKSMHVDNAAARILIGIIINITLIVQKNYIFIVLNNRYIEDLR